MAKPIVAIVGRPNVGKSQLFNRLAGKRLSIVEDTPGVTRDRLYADSDWRGRDFTVIDTGGIEPSNDNEILQFMRFQAETAISHADVIILITDLRTGITAADQDVASMLLRSGKPLVLAVNKCDKPGDPPAEFYEFYNLGLGEPYGISALHGYGVGELLDAAYEYFPPADEEEEDADRIRVALIGKPNVGKSSLLNRVLGEERVIVSNIAGTTRDSVDADVDNAHGKFTFIDTAGIRKKSKVDEKIEKFSVMRSLLAVERADVCVIMIDATEGVTEQDTKVAGEAHNAGKACIIVVNKWDLVEKDGSTMKEYTLRVREGLAYMPYAPVLFISAQTGQRVDKLFSLIHEVYEQTKKEYAEIAETSAKLIGERLDALCAKKDESVTVWNTLGHRRNDIVELGTNSAEALTDGTNVYPVQQTKDGAVIYAENLPSKGYQVLRPVSGSVVKTPFAIAEAGEGYTLETPFYTIAIDANGEFTSLFDKENDREVLQIGKTGNELRIYEDKPLQYSAWNLDIFHTEKSWKVEGVRRMEWTENGPVRATLEIEREVMDTVIRQQIHFYAKDRRIDFETYVDWKFAEHVLKVHFPVDVHSDEATYDIQFGNVTRKLHTNTSWDQAKFEVCGHKWADLSEGSYGVSLMNDCKYGYSMKDRVMTQTLIKSGTEPNLTADQEEHSFTYSLYPHAGTWREAGTVQEALNLNVPAKAVFGAAEKDRMEFLSADKRNVVLETVKKAEDGDGMIVRLYEVENARTKVTLHCAESILSAEETNLLEQPADGAIDVKENEISLTIKPYEIRTIRIRTEK